jgi:hypothetical protein
LGIFSLLATLYCRRGVRRGKGRRRKGDRKLARASPPHCLVGVEDPGAGAGRAAEKAVREPMEAEAEELDAPPPNFIAVVHIYTSATVTAYAYTSAPW